MYIRSYVLTIRIITSTMNVLQQTVTYTVASLLAIGTCYKEAANMKVLCECSLQFFHIWYT